ncbi:hypothetical protein D3C76_1690490 [compost metagenome]
MPVLCSDIPVFREHLDSEECSGHVLWFDPESPESISGALHQLTENYGYYRDLAQSIPRTHHETWEDTARKYADVFFEAHKRYHGY